MTPVIPCSTSNLFLIPGTAFTIKKNDHPRSGSFSRKSKFTVSSQRVVLPLAASVRLFQNCGRNSAHLHRSVVHKISATGTDVAVEDTDSSLVDEASVVASESSSDGVEAVESSTKSDASSPAQSRQSRPNRKSQMPPVKDEDLIPGATFTGKVVSIQPFGAFIDFGAFTNGLVHVSRLSDSFVKDVASVVSVGQEVRVRIVDANTETGRISLTMRDNDDTGKSQQQKDSAAAKRGDKPMRNKSNPNKRKEGFKGSKFVEGQILDGTVKNLTSSGAFISLPKGEEGFLPTSEEAIDGLANMTGSSSLQVGQEVSVRVLNFRRGKVTLTMKQEVDIKDDISEFRSQVEHVPTNPFLLAFSKNKDIASFLDEREKAAKPKDVVEIKEQVSLNEAVSDIAEVSDQAASSAEGLGIMDLEGSASVAEQIIEKDVSTVNDGKSDSSNEIAGQNLLSESPIHDGVLDSQPSSSIGKDETQMQNPTAEKIVEEVPSVDAIDSDGKSGASEEIPSPIVSSESAIEVGVNSQPDDPIAIDELQIQAPSTEDELFSTAPTEGDAAESLPDQNGNVRDSDGVKNLQNSEPSGNLSEAQTLSLQSQVIEEVAEKEVETAKDEVEIQTSAIESVTEVKDEKVEPLEKKGNIDDSQGIPSSKDSAIEEIAEKEVDVTKDEAQVLKTVDETYSGAKVQEEKVESAPERNANLVDSQAQNGSPAPKDSAGKATISPALVKKLREETGAGMMDCKKALSETGGDIVKAQEYLRKKGLASAEKKASRATAEGRIGSYIHDSRIGVLVEVNCETDFVSRGEIFKELVDDIAMQVAACPQVQYLLAEDVPEEIVNKEREIEMQKEDLLSKPEQIRSRIVEGRIKKRLDELALLEQPYIKNDKVVIKDFVKQTIATIGENIKVKRFVRYNLGEGLEKKSQDFAAEVAAQTAAKSAVAPAKEQSIDSEAKETEQKPPAVTVSAALVKQLREETGAGMMDCKKALSETGADLEKAKEYLRKKGLSTADKKSSRLAAEGRIGSYIHDSRIGVLIEVNCETDFVGRSEKFKELVDDLAMQVVACPQVQFVSIEDIDESVLKKEKEIEMQREDLKSKPENIREKIVEGRVSKRLGELALLEQPFIKNDSILVKDLVKQTVAALGENIQVRRFARFTLGETAGDA